MKMYIRSIQKSFTHTYHLIKTHFVNKSRQVYMKSLFLRKKTTPSIAYVRKFCTGVMQGLVRKVRSKGLPISMNSNSISSRPLKSGSLTLPHYYHKSFTVYYATT